MAELKKLYTVPFGAPRNHAYMMQSNPERRQWTHHYSSSYSTGDPRSFVMMDTGEHHTQTSEWDGGPSTNDLVEHGREHVGYWTDVGKDNIWPDGESTTERNFMLAKIANDVTKLVYNMGHKSTVTLGGSSQRANTDYCIIGAEGKFNPRNDSSGNGHASFGVNHIYMFYALGTSEGYYTGILEAVQKFLAFLECIAATPPGDSPDVQGCYEQVSGFGSVNKEYQKSVLIDLIEQVDFKFDVKVDAPRVPGIPGLPIDEILEILQEIVDAIFDKIDEIIVELTDYVAQLAQMISGVITAITTWGGDSTRALPEFLAELHPEPQSKFPMNKINWATELPEADRWFVGTVTPFVSRTIALLQLNCNGFLLVMSANKKSGVGSSDRRMEVYDWAPIYAPGGGRRTEPKALKVVANYDTRKVGDGYINIEPRTSTSLEIAGFEGYE